MGITGMAVLILILVGLLTFFIWLLQALAHTQPLKVGPSPAIFVEHDLARRQTPPKLGWNWWAFFLGPIWFLAEGLWAYALILITLLGLSAGLLLPFVMLYSGAKAPEILEDMRLARHTFY